ncbi:MAG TPA: NADH-quinone oxidoreductase subunit J [Ktedonobacterales bacterium]
MLFTQIAFYELAVVAVVSALGVVLNRNAVYCMLSLILNLLSLALFFLLLGGLFIATIQVLIYAGAVMVLFLFVVTMLTPGGAAAEGSDPMRWQWGAGIGMSLILVGALAYAGYSGAIASDARASGAEGLTQAIQSFGGNTEAFGMALFHGYSFPFEITGVLLVVAALGAVTLGRRPTRADE